MSKPVKSKAKTSQPKTNAEKLVKQVNKDVKGKYLPGKPKAAIDWDFVGKLIQAGGTGAEVAASIGIDVANLYRRCVTDLNINYAIFAQQNRAKGDQLLKSKQFQLAVGKGNPAMLIWLGKNRLGQSDKLETRATATDSELDWFKNAITAIAFQNKTTIEKTARAYLDSEQGAKLSQALRAAIVKHYQLDEAEPREIKSLDK